MTIPRLASVFTLAAILFITPAQAHICDPGLLTVPEGDVVPWHITADLEEKESIYTPVSLGNPAIATILPNTEFTARTAVFFISGIKEGKTTFSYRWFYPPTGDNGICAVEVTVLAPGSITNLSNFQIVSDVSEAETVMIQVLSDDLSAEPESLPADGDFSATGLLRILNNIENRGFIDASIRVAPKSDPTQTTTTSVSLLVLPEQSFKLGAVLQANGDVELSLLQAPGGPVTIEQSTDMRRWSPFRTFAEAPQLPIAFQPGETEPMIFRAVTGGPAIPVRDQLTPFIVGLPPNFSPAQTVLFWDIPTPGAPPEFDRSTSPRVVRFSIPLDPQELPDSGKIFYYFRNREQITPVITQSFFRTTETFPNLPPVISGLPDTITAPNNSRPTTIPLVVSDDRSFPNLLDITFKSQNTSILPDSHIVFSVMPDGRATLYVTPFFDETGTVPVTMTVFDGENITTREFNVVAVGSSPPTITPIGDYSFVVNSSSPRLSTEIRDAQSDSSELTLTGQSSNPAIVPSDGISISGFGAFRGIEMTPAPNTIGSTVITLTVSDPQGLSAQTSFNVTVTPTQSFHSDFNQDGRDDIIFQDDNGSLKAWFMNGSARLSENLLTPRSSGEPNWRVVGAGNFNSDGQPDLLFQNIEGALAAWYMNGVQMVSGEFLNPFSYLPEFRAVATADFNRDGKIDILFQSDEGYLSTWLMDGADRLSSPKGVGFQLDSGAKAVGAADFNLDNNLDILFQRPTGELAVWFLTGPFFSVDSEAPIATAPAPGQNAVAVGDFDNDGHPDIALQHTDGTLVAWFLNGLDVIRTETLNPPNPGTTWRVVAP